MATLTSPHIKTGSSTFHYDLVDLGHLCLSNLFMELHTMMGLAYNQWLLDKNPAWETTVSSLGGSMLAIISDLDELLSSDQNYLLGPWIKEARDSVSDGSSKSLYEFNARNQITLWGYHEGGINDYAAKAWGGLVKDYYYPRWELFPTTVTNAIKDGTPVDMDAYRQDRFNLEETWNMKVSMELCTSILYCNDSHSKCIHSPYSYFICSKHTCMHAYTHTHTHTHTQHTHHTPVCASYTPCKTHPDFSCRYHPIL